MVPPTIMGVGNVVALVKLKGIKCFFIPSLKESSLVL